MAKSQTPKKLSRREREEQRQFRRIMLFGGGAIGLAAVAGVGMTLLPPSFPTLEGEGTMAERLQGAGLENHVLKLTPDATSLDVMVIGTTDCIHCQKFVAEGLEDLVAFGKEEGLGIVYAPTGSSKSSLASTQLLSCFARGSQKPAIEILRAVYAAGKDISAGDSLAIAAGEYGKQLGVSERDIAACVAEDQLVPTQRVQALGRTFPIVGTPMFYVSSGIDAQKVHSFSGWAGEAGLRRQITSARSV